MSDKMIRFIDTKYKTLFTIPDGGYICVTNIRSGEEYISACKYIDDTHFETNGNCLHIHQFAKTNKHNNADVKPLDAPEIINGYRIYAKMFVGQMVYVSAVNPQAQPSKKFSTWQTHNEKRISRKARLFSNRLDAWTDLFLRAEGERRGVPYNPTPKRRDEAR
ncbi:MAG: hypothetical protein LBI19_01635 [Oscillospiraceae bacterium]|jgi:hypothetical protein|nr:hypothetical protein [Oscillospiraceae bacterium]